MLGDELKSNKTLVSLNMNSNELSSAKSFLQGLGSWLMVSAIELVS